MKILSATSILIICYLLGSCGTKGPLYIPEEKYPQSYLEQVNQNKLTNHTSFT